MKMCMKSGVDNKQESKYFLVLRNMVTPCVLEVTVISLTWSIVKLVNTRTTQHRDFGSPYSEKRGEELEKSNFNKPPVCLGAH